MGTNMIYRSMSSFSLKMHRAHKHTHIHCHTHTIHIYTQIHTRAHKPTHTHSNTYTHIHIMCTLKWVTLYFTYKAIGRSVLNYGAPVWTPSLSATNWSGLQRAQNNALRVATGCIKLTQVSHLHQETNILPVKEHSDMLTNQFLLSMHCPVHPNHHLLQKKPMQEHEEN